MAQGQQRGLDPTGKVFAFREPSQQLLVRGAQLINSGTADYSCCAQTTAYIAETFRSSSFSLHMLRC